ncbi:MAG: ATP-binding protein [Burkholderiales bacterium]
MNRYLSSFIARDVVDKMVFVTGPRQVGKTTLAKSLNERFRHPLYLNYDSVKDRQRITNADWPSTHDYVILDEIHAKSDWKSYLKGVFDTKPDHQSLLVTGSARLDTFRQTGESLAGRYFRWRLHPFSLKEFLPHVAGEDQALESLLRFGGFPEPLIKGTDSGRKRWQNQYFTDLVREDIVEFSRIHEIRSMRLLLEMLRTRTGSPLSFDALGREIGVSSNTIRSYIEILESLHIVFLVRPYHRNVSRALSKAPKLYFCDWAYVNDTKDNSPDSGARFENLVACHLLKHVQFLADSEGSSLQLHYVRTTSDHEIDFVLADENGEAQQFIEAKVGDTKPSSFLVKTAADHPNANSIQLVLRTPHGFDANGVGVRPAAQWLAALAA